jgi:hypothetical protein
MKNFAIPLPVSNHIVTLELLHTQNLIYISCIMSSKSPRNMPHAYLIMSCKLKVFYRTISCNFGSSPLDLCLALTTYEDHFICHICYGTGPRFIRSHLKGPTLASHSGNRTREASSAGTLLTLIAHVRRRYIEYLADI